MLSRLGHGTLLGPAALASWAREIGVAYLSPPEPLEKAGLERFLARLPPPALLLVDVFPRGLLGELEGLRRSSAAAWLVTRRVRPAYYLHPPVRAAIGTYARVFWTEEPPAELAHAFPRAERLAPVLLAPSSLSRDEARRRLGLPEEGRVVMALGAGPHDAQARLLRLLSRLAADMGARLLFVSDTLPERPEIRRLFPAAALLRAADALVAAGGYHSFHEARAAGVPTIFLPQRRRYDDQAGRVASGLQARDPESLQAALRAILVGAEVARTVGPRLEHPEAGAEALARRVREELEGRG